MDESRRVRSQPDPRQVFARDTRTPPGSPLVYLKNGKADALRDDALSRHLVCPITECEHPQFTTVGGAKRHHFRHLIAGAGHGYESLAHLQGKHLIGRWARAMYPAADVHVDDKAVDNGQRPDVLVQFPDGRQIAFEIQYAALTPDDWLRRHIGYAEQGITDVWLFGCGSAPFLPVELGGDARPNHVGLSDFLRRVVVARHPLLWIDPFDERIVTGVPYGRDLLYLRHPLARDAARLGGRIVLGSNSIDACSIEHAGFVTPGLLRARERLGAHTSDALLSARDTLRRRRAERERRRVAEARRREIVEAQMLEIAAKERWKQARAQEKAEQESRELEQIIRSRFPGGRVPAVLTTPLRRDRQVWNRHELWKIRAFLHLVQGCVGRERRFASFAHVVRSPKQELRTVFGAVSGFLFALREAGFVTFDSEGNTPRNPIRVVADLDHAPSPRRPPGTGAERSDAVPYR